MKNIVKAIAAVTFSLALMVPVVASATTQDVKKEKTEKVKKECTETKKCCSEKAEKKSCDKKQECSSEKVKTK